ncbi:MAG: NAD(P)/FAD-dependent oxidoreductase [Planctomycetes bacterium]|nr:NAD(P)/FAD-dependent oxidoreductase [Planctomycetota bacterium]
MPTDLDIAIIGAGAAGLMASIFAGRSAASPGALQIAALDGAAKIGAKILVAGGGRCNVTHDVVTPDDFFGGNRNQVTKVLRSFTAENTVAFFEELGVTLKREETGKLFPTTDDAQTVLDALLRAAGEARAELRVGCRVERVDRGGDAFVITTSLGELTARRVVLATGGKSLPKTGSDGHGYTIAQSLGHTVTATTPALVPLVLPKGHWLTTLSGLSLPVELTLSSASGKVLRRDSGPMLLTHFGLSGPVVLDISRHWVAEHASDPACRLTANLLPDDDFNSLDHRLQKSTHSQPRTPVIAVLRRLLPDRLAVLLLARHATIDPALPMAQLSKEDRRALAHALTALPLPVERDRGYLFAEVTAGGVPLSEVDVSTMASRRCPGLFLCGEVLDVDGRIGGYNFQWAWASGRLAGIHAVKSLL